MQEYNEVDFCCFEANVFYSKGHVTLYVNITVTAATVHNRGASAQRLSKAAGCKAHLVVQFVDNDQAKTSRSPRS